MSLKEYKNKRNFESSPEPKDEKGKDLSKGNRFVIQCHHASHLHYDLRLQVGDSLKSWAIPKGPSLNPADQRLSVRVEDHPLAYADFEGVIPAGNYGAGTVMIWDEGTYLERTAKDHKETSLKTPPALEKGHLTFLLFGKRLQGEFALIRMGSSRNWLLVKKWDQHATNKLVPLVMTSVRSGLDFKAIAASGRLWQRQGQVKASPMKLSQSQLELGTQSSPEKSLMPHNLILAQPLTPPSVTQEDNWLLETWSKGIRGLLIIDGHKSSFRSKSKIDYFQRFSKLRSLIYQIPTTAILDLTLLNNEELRPTFIVWDILFWQGDLFINMPLKARLPYRADFCSELEIFRIPDQLKEDHSQNNIKVLKRYLSSPYPRGISGSWMKAPLTTALEIPAATISLSSPRKEQKPDASGMEQLLDLYKAYKGPVRLSHPEKLLWPSQGITKAHLFGYYRLISSYLLDYLHHRPLALQRFPQGIQSQGFFQKDFVGYLPKYVSTYPISSASSGRAINYLLAHNEDTLLYLANLAVVEINPWLSRVPNFTSPDVAVIDLDPDGHDFKQVLEVATFINELLKRFAVKSICKTSGATGLHIFLPLQSDTSFDASRELCLSIARQVIKKFPKLTSIERSPSRRRRLIYIDCLQNRKSQTIVAPFSPRPGTSAAISMPVDWSDVISCQIHPDDFTIDKLAPLLERASKIWQSIDGERYNASELSASIAKA